MTGMPPLTTADLRRGLDLVYALNSDTAGPIGGPSSAVLAEIGQLVGADVTSYVRVDHRTDRLAGAAVEPAEQDISARGVPSDVRPAARADRGPRRLSRRRVARWRSEPA
jgi:hypothetical protein